MSQDGVAAWWARGLLFENCSCQAVCPGHVHFDQLCTHERCVGYWALRFDEGEFGGIPLAGARAVMVYDAPQHMIDGGWTEVLVIDEQVAAPQRRALEIILTGQAGGPWEVLGRFVARRLPTRYLPIQISEDKTIKQVWIEGLLEGSIEELRGRDRSKPVTIENMYNQIHPVRQVVAKGSARYDDGEIVFVTDGSHALHSAFDWSVGVA